MNNPKHIDPRLDPTRTIRAPRGAEKTCKSWLTEAAYRMIQNNLDAEVAEHPHALVVYGGIGRAARNWDCFDQILATLKDLNDTGRGVSATVSSDLDLNPFARKSAADEDGLSGVIASDCVSTGGQLRWNQFNPHRSATPTDPLDPDLRSGRSMSLTDPGLRAWTSAT